MPTSADAYTPKQIAELIKNVGIKKAELPFIPLVTLGILAGAFIAFGGMFYTVVITDSALGLGVTRFLGGLAFCLGLILVVVAGAELFTGNNLIVIAWAERKVSTMQLFRNWSVIYVANLIGAIATALIVIFSGILDIGDGALAETATKIAQGKVALDFGQAFFRGVLCNALVCLAIWLCFAAHTVTDKILAIIFPITAFVALGFEHSVANMYLISVAAFNGNANISIHDFISNLIPVTLGNIVGGSIFVALTYWICYLRFPCDK